ncbi:MAG: hypothetical protein M3Q34_04520 [bacterium]|nr:hypothetical protein [bacterium]
MEYKILLGYLAVIIQLISYGMYFFGIWKGKTKPHAFTWLVWSVLNAVAFAAVIISGGETGAWVLGLNTLLCLLISGVGFWQKRIGYDLYDWFALIGALVGIFLWWLTDNPLYAVILVSIADFTGTIPLFRKAYKLPFEENASSFILGVIAYPVSILALESLTLTTWLYPASVFLIDGILIALIFIRRKKLRAISSH